MGRYQAAAEVSYAEGKRECVCCGTRGRNRSAVLLADFPFPAVQQCIVSLSLSHTHSHSQGLATFFFLCCSLFLSHTVPDQSLPPHPSACLLNPLPNADTHSHTALVHTAATIRWNISNFFPLFWSPPLVPPSTLFLPHGNPSTARALSYAYFCVYDGRVERGCRCSYQIIGESIKINHITNKLRWDR